MQSLRVRGLRPGEEYTFPVRLRKVLEIKDKYNLFTSPAHYWVSKKEQTIPTSQRLRVRKSPLERVRTYSPDIIPISRREVRPVDRDEVRRVVETIVQEQSIPANAYLVLDYGVETSLGRFIINLWWFPQDAKIFMQYSNWRPTLGEIGGGTSFYMPEYIVPNVIGHESIKQVYGPRLGFEWEQDRTQEMRNYQRAHMPQSMVPYWERESRRAPAAEPENVYRNIPDAGLLNIPSGATNTITMNTIAEGDDMVNFHGEHGYGRFYKQSTFDQLPIMNSYLYKKNPTTRRTIRRNNTLRKYKAHLTPVTTAVSSQVAGSKRWRSGKKTRRNR